MHFGNSVMKKIISILVTLCFCNLIATDIFCAVVPANTIPYIEDVSIAKRPLLPVDIGKVVQDMYVLGDRTIINIQDLHSDEYTQKNIISILDYLVNNYNVQNIYFEGAIGNLNFGWLNSIKDEKLKKDVATKLLQDSKITGAEYFGLFNQKGSIRFKGLEEEKIYKENFILLEQMYEDRINIQKEMNNISNMLQDATKNTYNFKLAFVDSLINDYNNKNISQAEYYSYLFKLLKNKNISFDYTAISEFLQTEKNFKSLNYKKTEKELAQINKELKESLSYEKYSKLQKLFPNYPNQYYNELLNFVLNNNLEKKYSEFIKFSNCLRQKNSINIVDLFQEERNLTDALYEECSENIIEKNLVFLNLYTKKILQFFTNSLPSFEYEYIENNFDKYCILLENYVSNTDIIKIKQWFKTVNKFYSNNEKRNLTFLENMLKKKISKTDFVNNLVVKNDNRKSFEEILQSTKQPVDIMVTGGYHSQGLKDLMAKLNINYAVIMPNIVLADSKQSKEKFYRDYLKQYSILSNTYQKFIRSSVMNTEWKDPVKVMIGTFFDYSLLQELDTYLQSLEDVTEILKLIQQHFSDILKAKGLEINLQIKNIEKTNDNSFVITVLSNGKERLFYISDNVVGEIHSKDDISKIEKEIKSLNEQQPKTESSRKRLLKKLARFITIIVALPVLAVMGGGGGIFLGKREHNQSQPKKGLTNNGATLNVTNADQVEYIDTVVDEGSQISLEGKITLNNVFVGKDNKFSIKAGKETIVTVKDIDMTTVEELDITIEDNGEYEIVSEDGIIKVYKVLRTDFSSSTKKRMELVSMLKKGSLFLPNESDWSSKETKPIIVFYGRFGVWSGEENINKRTELLYKDKEVIYINISDCTSMSGNIDIKQLERILEKKKLKGRSFNMDLSIIEDRYSKPLMEFGDFWLQQTEGVTFLNTYVPISLFVKSEHYFNRENKHLYLNPDGTYRRYPYKDRNWLRTVLLQYMPSFKDKTFVFVWPVESVKYTYYTPQNADGGTPEQRVPAFEPFKQFMDKAIEYSDSGKDSIVFMPGYLISELSMYLKNPDIGSNFVDITYGNTEEINPFNIWYKKQDAKQVEKIEVLKLGKLTIVMYPEGNRGHNEQAYLKTLMATYTFGKESFDSMLTQAGFTWKANTVYVFEGKEMENLDMEAQLLKNPSIKTGKVSYVYDNLKRVFIDLYTNMNRFFRSILPKFTKGNWVSVEEEIRETIDITQIKESVTAKSKLGFDSFAVIPVKANLLNEQEYGTPVILEQDGKKVSVYTLTIGDSKVYLVGVTSKDTIWQDCVLNYVRDFLKDYKNNIISFDGLPQISAQRTNYLFNSFIPVVLNSDYKINGLIQALGYDDIIDTSDIVSRMENSQLKYPYVASDMKEISEAITIIKALKRKSFLGQFAQEKTSYVGVKIASDEHIFNNEMEENEFIEILKGTDIDFVTVVIRDNDLGVHVLNRETTVKENLIKLSQQLHKVNKEIVLEYTFRFIDEFFKTFVRAIQEDCKDMNLDGIKLDLADCSVEDIGKIIKDLTSIRETLPNLNISLQVSNKVWEKYSSSFEELNITRTVSSKEELLIGEHDLSANTDVNYEISIYKNQQEYEQKVFSLSNQRDRLLDKDPEDVSYALRPLLELGEEKFADQIIDNRLEAIFQKVVLNDSIGKLILPVNMLYAKRLEDNENSNVIQAVSNLIRLFKESKGMNERRLFAYEYGLQQNIVLTDEQEKEIAEILRGESKSSAGNYVRKNFPYVFDYFVESRQTRIEISDSFLFGIYEANIIRKYKEGYFGKVLEFVVDSNVSFDTQERVDTRQSLFYKALAQIYLYKDAENIQDIFSLNDNEYKYYDVKTYKDNYMNAFVREISQRTSIYNGMTVFQKGLPLLIKTVNGYLPNRKETLYEARLLMKALLMAYKTQEIEPVLIENVEDNLQIEDTFIDENINMSIDDMLARA